MLHKPQEGKEREGIKEESKERDQKKKKTEQCVM